MIYPPHGACWFWNAWLVTMHAGGDFLIFLAYLAIPALMFSIAKKVSSRTGAPLPAILFPHLFGLWALFILCCGMTHFMETVTVFTPWFWLSASIKVATALISLVALLATWRNREQIIRFGCAIVRADLSHNRRKR